MVIVKLRGGLGNQMFQYATGLRLANSNGLVLKIDLSDFQKPQKNGTQRPFFLDRFNTTAGKATPQDVKLFFPGSFPQKAWTFFLTSLGKKKSTAVIREKQFHFDPNVMKISGNVYLDGYWQSEKYFLDIRKVLLEEFSSRYPLDSQNRPIADQIASSVAVSVHVRRGDYVSCAKTADYHGVCSVDYYQLGISVIFQRVKNPVFFVFSDDPAWARANIKTYAPMVFIDHNGSDNASEDFRLMSLCRHHIISNSTFSWWGAWLSKYSDKIVLAPKRWFVDPNINTNDLIPKTWNLL